MTIEELLTTFATALSSGGVQARLLNPPDREEFLAPSTAELVGVLVAEPGKRLVDRIAERSARRRRIAVRAAERFGHDRIDHAERLEVLRGDLHRLGGVGR